LLLFRGAFKKLREAEQKFIESDFMPKITDCLKAEREAAGNVIRLVRNNNFTADMPYPP